MRVCNLSRWEYGFPLTAPAALGILCPVLQSIAQGLAVNSFSSPHFLRPGRLVGTAAFLLLGLATSQVQAAGTASEAANVEVMIRQLNAIEAVARRSAELPGDGSARYHLDYNRLAADLARIRQGLQEYLTPSRAQPRDVTDLSGQYQREGSQP